MKKKNKKKNQKQEKKKRKTKTIFTELKTKKKQFSVLSNDQNLSSQIIQTTQKQFKTILTIKKLISIKI